MLQIVWTWLRLQRAVIAFENNTCSISIAVVPLGANGSTPTYKCFNGTCREAVGGRVPSECEQACAPAAYKCVGGKCVLDPGGVGKSDCAAICDTSEETPFHNYAYYNIGTIYHCVKLMKAIATNVYFEHQQPRRPDGSVYDSHAQL